MSEPKIDLTDENIETLKSWTTANKKNGPRFSPIIRVKHTHDTLNHANRKIVDWFRTGYPEHHGDKNANPG